MIVVEGCDNSGKTTLLNMLSKLHGIPTVQGMGPARQETTTRQWIDAALDLPQLTRRVIYDRFPLISERIYGPIIRKMDVLNPETCAWVRAGYERFRFLDPLIIWCRPPRDAIVKNWQEREQMAGVEENLDALLSAYDEFFRSFKDFGNVMVYDYTEDRADQILPYVSAYLAKSRNVSLI